MPLNRDFTSLQMMEKELGREWRQLFQHFETIPFASASIGQVHKATLLDGQLVAVKLQYPGVAESIQTDLSNLRLLLKFGNFLPPGLFLDNTIKVAQRELEWEVDYNREMENCLKFASLLADDPYVKVPKMFLKLCTKRVLTMEFVEGEVFGCLVDAPQFIRDRVGREFLHLTLRELFQFRFMQTDPNFSNFLHVGQGKVCE